MREPARSARKRRIRPYRQSGDDQETRHIAPERRIWPGFPNERLGFGRQLPLGPTARKEIEGAEHVAAGMEHHAGQCGISEVGKRAVHRGHGDIKRQQHDPYLRVREMRKPKQVPGHQDRDYRPVPALNRPLQVTTKRCLLDDAGDDRTHHDPHQYRDNWVPRHIEIPLLRQHDESAQDSLKE